MEAIAEINIVPFVDIILVVLIIFMVTTPLIMKPSINVNLPKAASGEETQLNISIAATGEIRVNGQPSDDAGIGNSSVAALKKDNNVQAIISADKDVPHGKVVSVIDIVKSSGIKKFAITIDNK